MGDADDFDTTYSAYQAYFGNTFSSLFLSKQTRELALVQMHLCLENFAKKQPYALVTDESLGIEEEGVIYE